ncbi:FlgO family outer membrane protein [Pleionea sp. CnH1-48]|uniref:FlgO family outer membrane protein n=1 Tax=Pleionea sp. CnH1-48 TaxID=2954494 RepID=UPI002097D93C|nr:FlgO family outer membrane protein [Pleionea sp. CnH1-48]MCO7223392.1 FlgO family outer membrane protein [Pleionea sp. CnH1-48]
MSVSSHQYLQLGDWFIDCQQMLLKQDDQWLDIPVLSFKLLMALAQSPGVVVSADELIKSVWGQKVVSDENLQQRIRMLRKLLQDDSQNATYIGTARGKGYRLLIEPVWLASLPEESVETSDLSSTPLPPEPISAEQASSPRAQATHAGKKNNLIATLTVALSLGVLLVLGVQWMSTNTSHTEQPIQETTLPLSIKRLAVLPIVQEDPLQQFEGLGEGLTEQLIQGLSQNKNLQVIAYASVAGYQQQPKKLNDIAQELNVDALLMGDVSNQGERFLISLRLLNTQDESVLWRKKFDLPTHELAGFSDQLLSAISAPFAHDYHPRHPQQSTYQDAYSLYLKGRKHYLRYNRLDNQMAEKLFRQSLAQSPAFTLALCGLSDTLSQKVQQYEGSWADSEEALRLAEAAVNLQSDLAEAYKAKGFALDTQGRYPESIEAYQKAIELNPNYADAMLNKAVLHWESGDYASAYELVNQVITLDPLEVFGHLLKANILAGAGDFERAEPLFRQLLLHHPDNLMVAQGQGQFLFDQGDYKGAADAAQNLLRMAPYYTPAVLLAADSFLFNGEVAKALEYYRKLAALKSSWKADYALLRIQLIEANQKGHALSMELWPEDTAELNQTQLLTPTVNQLLMASYFEGQVQLSSTNLLARLIEQDRVHQKWLAKDPHLQRLRSLPKYSTLLEQLANNKRQHQQLLLQIDQTKNKN